MKPTDIAHSTFNGYDERDVNSNALISREYYNIQIKVTEYREIFHIFMSREKNDFITRRNLFCDFVSFYFAIVHYHSTLKKL